MSKLREMQQIKILNGYKAEQWKYKVVKLDYQAWGLIFKLATTGLPPDHSGAYFYQEFSALLQEIF